jgi:hypothetical protein
VVIAQLGLKHRLPIMTQFSRIVEAGGLMAYVCGTALVSHAKMR